MQTLAIVNPSRRRRRKSGKRRSAAQRAATRRMLAANRARKGGGRKRVAKRRGRRTAVAVARVNPIRRHRRRSARASYRRNPISLSKYTGVLADAAVGAVGAVIVNTGLNYLPASLKARLMVGNLQYATKLAAAVALGVVGAMLPSKIGRYAAKAAEGSMTVTMYDVVKLLGAKAGMSLGYAGSGYGVGPVGPMIPAMMGEYVHGMGEYVHGLHGVPEMGGQLNEYVR